MTTQSQIDAIKAAATQTNTQAQALVAGKVTAEQLKALETIACSVYTGVYDLKPDTTVPPPQPAMTFTAKATGTNECTVSWSGVSPTKLARDGTDSYNGGPWDTGELSGQLTSGSFKFTYLIPGNTYKYTLTYGTGQTLTVSLLQPAIFIPPPPPPVSGGTAGFGQPVMAPPVGTRGQYPTSKLLWQEKFSGTSLDLTKWAPVMGGPSPVGPWGDSSGKPIVNNGLTLSNVNGRACVNTMDPRNQKYLFNFPSAGWFIAINAKFSDMTKGFWPALWFPTSNPHAAAVDHPEIDIFEGGMIGGGVPSGNRCWEGNLGGGNSLWPSFMQNQKSVDVGVDMTQSFNVFGCEWVPNVSCTFYVNGKVVNAVPASRAGGIPVTPDYNFVMTPQNGGSAGGWHTSGPGTGEMQIAEIQVYALP